MKSIALLGWAAFEPEQAPKLSDLDHYKRYAGMFPKGPRTEEEIRTQTILSGYGFPSFEEIDAAILAGLQAGGFDGERLKKELTALNDRFSKDDVRRGINQPWEMFRNSFDDDEGRFVEALAGSVEKFFI